MRTLTHVLFTLMIISISFTSSAGQEISAPTRRLTVISQKANRQLKTRPICCSIK